MEIAEWLLPHLQSECRYCGAPIVDNDNLTDRYCSNPACPGHLSYKVAAIMKKLGIKGVGPATALADIQLYKYPYPAQYISRYIADKPKAYLWQVGEYAMVKGFQKRWQDICYGKHSMAEVCDAPDTPQVLKDNRELLLATEKCFEVLQPLEGERIFVMLTGSFDGYRSRKDFIAEMNARHGSYVQLVDVGKRKTGVQFLIKEAWTSDHEKSAIAAEYHIPDDTPAQMKEMLEGVRAYISEGGAST